jgi:hypothetical protein
MVEDIIDPAHAVGNQDAHSFLEKTFASRREDLIKNMFHWDHFPTRRIIFSSPVPGPLLSQKASNE